MQAGHDPDTWPEVVFKELIDNSLDASEGAGLLPEITVQTEPHEISVSDNGPGLPTDVVKAILDFSLRASSKDAYISPTRGAQGNALKTVIAIPYVLSGCEQGKIEIISQGIHHQISLDVDRIEQKPAIEHNMQDDGLVKNGTLVKVHWPRLASSNPSERNALFLQMLSAYSLFNCHATFNLSDSRGQVARFNRTSETCNKWVAGEPTSPHWYNEEQLRNLIAAYIASERYGEQAKTVRAFVSEFRGLKSTAKQKTILSRLKLSDIHLRDLVTGGDVDRKVVQGLLKAMREESKPVKPLALGPVGEQHFKTWLETHGGEIKTFQYKRIADVDPDTSLPFLVEFAFAVRNDSDPRRLITGINWSPTLADPFRRLAGYGLSLQGLLGDLHIGPSEPVTFVIHLACPHLNYTDRGKSSLEGL